jgi:hypothetical protein
MKTVRNNYIQKQHGQALVVLLFYMVIAITITTTAVALSISNSITTMQEEEGNHVLEVAETGAENAILRLLRNTNFTNETISVGDGIAAATVSGTTTKTVISKGTIGTMARIVQVTLTFHNGVMSIASWKQQ